MANSLRLTVEDGKGSVSFEGEMAAFAVPVPGSDDVACGIVGKMDQDDLGDMVSIIAQAAVDVLVRNGMNEIMAKASVTLKVMEDLRCHEAGTTPPVPSAAIAEMAAELGVEVPDGQP